MLDPNEKPEEPAAGWPVVPAAGAVEPVSENVGAVLVDAAGAALFAPNEPKLGNVSTCPQTF